MKSKRDSQIIDPEELLDFEANEGLQEGIEKGYFLEVTIRDLNTKSEEKRYTITKKGIEMVGQVLIKKEKTEEEFLEDWKEVKNE